MGLVNVHIPVESLDDTIKSINEGAQKHDVFPSCKASEMPVIHQGFSIEDGKLYVVGLKEDGSIPVVVERQDGSTYTVKTVLP